MSRLHRRSRPQDDSWRPVRIAGLPDRLARADRALDKVRPGVRPPAENTARLVEALGLVVDEVRELRLVVCRLETERPTP
jgi:hypothetical protein